MDQTLFLHLAVAQLVNKSLS